MDDRTIELETTYKPLSWKEKIAFASGNIPGGIFGTIMGALQAFYYAWMGLEIKYIVWAQVIYGIWNLVNDPIFGYLQAKTHTKKGRYIPWIKWAAIPFSVFFILVFIPPQSWRRAVSQDTFQIALFSWYLVSQVLYDTTFTISYIAYTALLPHITINQKERTQLNILSSVMFFVGMGLCSIFPVISLTNPTAESIAEFQKITIIFAIIAIVPWIGISFFVNENHALIPDENEEGTFWQNIKYVFQNRPARFYIWYDGMSVGFNMALQTALFFIIPWVFGINNPYNTDSNWDLGAAFPYFIFPILGVIVGIVIQLWIPKKRDVKGALSFSMAALFLGLTLAFIGVITSDNLAVNSFEIPSNLWLVSIGLGIAFLGFSGDMMYHEVMRGDTIDYDELTTGERRESVYTGTACIFSKPMISVALAAVPAIMGAFGLIPASDEFGAALIADDGYKSATIGVATAGFLFPSILALLGLIVWVFYPLNQKALNEMRKKLKILHTGKEERHLGK